MSLPIRALGNRIALIESDDKGKEVNGIFLTNNPHRGYMAMGVAAKGNGVVGGAKVPMCEVEVGDRVFVQTNPMQVANNVQKVGDQSILVIHEHDVLAILTKDIYDLTLTDFQPVGTWILLRIETPEKVGAIWLPGSDQPLKSPGEVKLYLEKQGKLAEHQYGIPLGARVAIDQSRANPLALDVSDATVAANSLGVSRTRRQRFVYVDAAHVNAFFED